MIGIEVFVGDRGLSGLSVRPLRCEGDMSGLEISMGCWLLSAVFREPPRKSFFVENLRARLEPVEVVGVTAGGGVGSSGVGRGCKDVISNAWSERSFAYFFAGHFEDGG